MKWTRNDPSKPKVKDKMAWQYQCTLYMVFFVLVEIAITTSSPPKPEFCTPRQTTKGDKQTIVLVVKEYSSAAADFQQYPATLKSTNYHKLQNDGRLLDLTAGVRARFSGGSVCVSAIRLSVTDEGGVNERKEFSCERVCLDTSGQTLKLTLNSTNGGRVWPGRLCCVWGTERYLILSLQRPSYRCVTCRGKQCRQADVGTSRQCAPGARCFSLTLQQPTSPSPVTPLYSGCTSDVMFSGYSCWNDCRHSVRVAGSTIKSQVCLHCCTGNSCNVDFNATLVNTTREEIKARVDRRAHGHTGGPLCASFPLALFVVSASFILVIDGKWGHL